MRADRLKDMMPDLPEEHQDLLARLALQKLEKRVKLERVAAPSVQNKIGWFVPWIIILCAVLWRPGLMEYLPFIAIVVLISQFVYLQARMDAIYELMRLEKENAVRQDSNRIGDPPETNQQGAG